MGSVDIVKKEITTISSNLSNLGLKNQFDINEIVLNLSDLLLNMNVTVMNDVRKAFDNSNDAIKELIDSLDNIDKEFEQSVFMAGQLYTMFNIVNNVYKKILVEIEESIDRNDEFIRDVIFNVGYSSLSHGELSKKLGISPANLTMRMKRNCSWKKYVSVYANPKKQNSVIYILNNSGKAVCNEYSDTFNQAVDVGTLSKLSFSNDYIEKESIYDKRRIVSEFSKPKFKQGI